jgi:hypothetical protein
VTVNTHIFFFGPVKIQVFAKQGPVFWVPHVCDSPKQGPVFWLPHVCESQARTCILTVPSKDLYFDWAKKKNM